MATETKHPEHTEEPWFTGQENPPQSIYWGVIAVLEHNPDKRVLIWQDKWVLAHEANARRIVACVNACAGLTTKQLEYALEKGVTLLQIIGDPSEYVSLTPEAEDGY